MTMPHIDSGQYTGHITTEKPATQTLKEMPLYTVCHCIFPVIMRILDPKRFLMCSACLQSVAIETNVLSQPGEDKE